MAPSTTCIRIAAGTIISRKYNSKRLGRTVEECVTLRVDVIIDDASRADDGCWTWAIQGDAVYFCAGGLAEPMDIVAEAIAALELEAR